MDVTRFKVDHDYKDLCSWWKDQGRAILHPDLLPVLGFVAMDKGEKVSMSWLYVTDSRTGFVAWTVANPKCSSRQVSKSFKILNHSIESAAKVTGLRALFQFSGGGGFSRLLIKSGWKDSLIKHDFLFREIT